MEVIVQKFGGATLATPEKIKSLAKKVAKLRSQGKSMIVVVSAMGGTTNELLDLSRGITLKPNRRELDMLLTAGERISMSLMSMALSEYGCPAISFTGSQAGLLTNETHSNAMIIDLKPFRVEEALQKNKVVVLAGFQGVSPSTKEVTTLGRGGSDTTAVALAAHFKAKACEILKEVEGVYSADPRKVEGARLLTQLSYQQLLEMTFWGAKVLHSRAAELALTKKVPLLIKAAHDPELGGTQIGGFQMYEQQRVLSVNSFERLLKLSTKAASAHEALEQLLKFIDTHQIGETQILRISPNSSASGFEIYLTGPKEVISAIELGLPPGESLSLSPLPLATVTVTCTGTTAPGLLAHLCLKLKECGILIHDSFVSGMSVSFVVNCNQHDLCLQSLHQLTTLEN